MLRRLFMFSALLGVSGIAMADVIDFDSLSNLTVVTNQYPGAIFSSAGNATNRAYSFFGATSAPNILCTADGSGSITCVEPTFIDFTSPISGLTFWAIEPNTALQAATFNVYQNSVLTATVPFFGLGGGGNKFVDLSAYSNITRLELLIHPNEVPSNGIGWDDFRYTSVPEPASLAFLAGGALVLLRRRRA